MTDILQKAQEIVQERKKVYGSAAADFRKIAKLWSAYLNVEIRPEQVPGCMILLKLARLSVTPNHEDSCLDIAGYADCYWAVIEDETLKTQGDL